MGTRRHMSSSSPANWYSLAGKRQQNLALRKHPVFFCLTMEEQGGALAVVVFEKKLFGNDVSVNWAEDVLTFSVFWGLPM